MPNVQSSLRAHPGSSPADELEELVVLATQEALGASSKEARKSGPKHFFRFLETIGREEANRLISDDSTGDIELWPDGEVPRWSNIIMKRINPQLMNAFAGYLGRDATHLNNEKKQLMLASADNYFSATKNYIIETLENEQRINQCVLKDSTTMKNIRASMVKTFKQRARANNQAVKNSHQTATEDDVRSLALICLWAACPQLAVFHCFFIALAQLAGRGSEAAGLGWTDLTTPKVQEFAQKERLIHARLSCDKQLSEQEDLSIFPHRDDFLQDFYFSLCCMMIMDESPCDELFPRFAEAAEKDAEKKRKKQKRSSSVSKLFSELYKKVLADAANIEMKLDASATMPGDFQLNKNLSSHSPRRFSIETMNQNPNINLSWLCFRVGWEVRAMLTLFEYLNRCNKNNDRQCARATSGWSQISATGKLGGGRPPKLDCFSDPRDREALAQLRHLLFHRYENIEGANNVELQNLLLATLLKCLPDLITTLVNHPTAEFGVEAKQVWEKHLLMRKLKDTAKAGGAMKIASPDETVEQCLLRWSDCIHKDWARRNFAYLPEEQLVRAGQDPTLPIDPRTIAGNFQSLQSQVGQNTVQMEVTQQLVKQQAQEIQELKALNRQLLTTAELAVSRLDHLERLFTSAIASNSVRQLAGTTSDAGTSEGLERQVVADSRGSVEQQEPVRPRNNAAEPSTLRASNEVSWHPLLKVPIPPTFRDKKVVNLFEDYFMYGWHLQLPGASKTTKNTVRDVVSFLSLFVGMAVPPLPQGVRDAMERTPTAKKWRTELKRIALEAFDNFVQFYKTNRDKMPRTGRKQIVSETPPDKVSTWKVLMGSMEASVLDSVKVDGQDAPPIHDCFQPTKTSERLYSKAELVSRRRGRRPSQRKQQPPTHHDEPMELEVTVPSPDAIARASNRFPQPDEGVRVSGAVVAQLAIPQATAAAPDHEQYDPEEDLLVGHYRKN